MEKVNETQHELTIFIGSKQKKPSRLSTYSTSIQLEIEEFKNDDQEIYHSVKHLPCSEETNFFAFELKNISPSPTFVDSKSIQENLCLLYENLLRVFPKNIITIPPSASPEKTCFWFPHSGKSHPCFASQKGSRKESIQPGLVSHRRWSFSSKNDLNSILNGQNQLEDLLEESQIKVFSKTKSKEPLQTPRTFFDLLSGKIHMTSKKFISLFLSAFLESQNLPGNSNAFPNLIEWILQNCIKTKLLEPFWHGFFSILFLAEPDSELSVFYRFDSHLIKLRAILTDWDVLLDSVVASKKPLGSLSISTDISFKYPSISRKPEGIPILDLNLKGKKCSSPKIAVFNVKSPKIPKNFPDFIVNPESKEKSKRKEKEIIVNQENPLNFYEIIETVGQGTFGTVKKVKHKFKGEFFAMKVIKKGELTAEQLELVTNEVEIMFELDHPSICRVHEMFETKKTICIVMDLAEGGELFCCLEEDNRFSEEFAKEITMNILKALVFLQEHNIVHRDIKQENILFEKSSESAQVKLIDFGVSTRFSPGEKLNEFYGTCFYMAPEVIKGSYDEKIDIWGVGVLLYTMLAGSFPFNGEDEDAVYTAISNYGLMFVGDPWNSGNVSQDAVRFIKSLLTYDPKKRPTPQRALEHEWFKKKTGADQEKYPKISQMKEEEGNST